MCDMIIKWERNELKKNLSFKRYRAFLFQFFYKFFFFHYYCYHGKLIICSINYENSWLKKSVSTMIKQKLSNKTEPDSYSFKSRDKKGTLKMI